LLVKPQFEVGRDQVGAGGIVRDPRLWSQAVSTVNEALAEHGLILHGVDVSPVVGTKGNREFVVWYRTDEPSHDIAGGIAAAVRRAEIDGDAARNDA
jgi:23S rRNA (cytidine1920-2'-O)/16S rRNA (cytidine1409-2'-O)-methyltransferase